MKSLLVIDVGNSSTKFGFFQGEKLKKVWRSATPLLKKISHRKLDAVIISSVVPRFNKPLRSFLRKRFKIEPLFVTTKTMGPIKIRKRRPQSGADRIANAVAAYPIRPVIVIDIGTITTFDVINREGEIVGASFFPGPGICNNFFHEKTAKLPKVPLAVKKKVLGHNTIEVMQVGLFHGYGALVDGMIGRIRKEQGKNLKVIATGGLAPWVAKSSKKIQKVDPFLTLRGLQLIYQYHAS
ncbi:MAG: type III pantothenate kinase [Deltaproteobacteria bacterium]|nr:type III pantothenate kinase [Deltaproteobacteria bacterium]